MRWIVLRVGAGPNPLRHIDVGSAPAVRVRHDAHDHKAEARVELKGMSGEVADPRDMLPDVRIEIDIAEAGLAALVVGADLKRPGAALAHKRFEILHQGATDAPALDIGAHHQGMKLPDIAVIVRDAADPAEHIARGIDGNAAYPLLGKRLVDFGT